MYPKSFPWILKHKARHMSFNHWEYKDAAGQWQTTPGNPLNNMALTIYMNWWTGTGIHVPNGKDVFVVKAVFEKSCPCGPDCYPNGSNLTSDEITLVQTCFPNIRLCNVYKTAEQDPAYNCIAFVGRENRWVWNEIDQPPYGNNNGLFERQEFVNYFNARGVSDYLIYGSSQSGVKHAARRINTCAESKLGKAFCMRHDAHEMEGGSVYGNILP